MYSKIRASLAVLHMVVKGATNSHKDGMSLVMTKAEVTKVGDMRTHTGMK